MSSQPPINFSGSQRNVLLNIPSAATQNPGNSSDRIDPSGVNTPMPDHIRGNSKPLNLRIKQKIFDITVGMEALRTRLGKIMSEFETLMLASIAREAAWASQEVVFTLKDRITIQPEKVASLQIGESVPLSKLPDSKSKQDFLVAAQQYSVDSENPSYSKIFEETYKQLEKDNPDIQGKILLIEDTYSLKMSKTDFDAFINLKNKQNLANEELKKKEYIQLKATQLFITEFPPNRRLMETKQAVEKAKEDYQRINQEYLDFIEKLKKQE